MQPLNCKTEGETFDGKAKKVRATGLSVRQTYVFRINEEQFNSIKKYYDPEKLCATDKLSVEERIGRITRHTLVGFRKATVNTRYFEGLVNPIKNKPEHFIKQVNKFITERTGIKSVKISAIEVVQIPVHKGWIEK